MRKRYYLGWILIALILATTWFLWYREAGIGSSWLILTNVGQVLGLTGITLFALTLVLNTRWRILEEIFGGLDKVYFAHHTLGALTLIVLLFHPVSLAVSYASFSPLAAADFLLSFSDFAINMGKLALTSLILFLILTFFVKLPYHIWKFTHQFLGVVFIIASIHVYNISSDVAYNLPLRYYILGLICLGSFAYLYRILLHRYFLPKHWFSVTSAKSLNGQITQIELEPEKKNIQFTPGQFVFIRFKSKSVSWEQHPFSITSQKGDQLLKLAVKNLGDFTSNLSALKKGDKAVVEGPYGKFAKNAFDKKAIWIAGGIGITPFMSLARSFKGQVETYLFFSVKERHEFVYLDELNKIASKYKNFHVVPWLSEEKGHLTPDAIKLHARIDFKSEESLNNWNYFLCGPIRMMMGIKKELIKEGVSAKNIYYEEFELV